MKDHGVWVRYVPDELPPGVPAGSIMFFHRVNDNVDWYQYVQKSMTFPDPTTIKLTMAGNVCVTASYDPTTLVPDGYSILEITDPSHDPSYYFGRELQNGEFILLERVPTSISDRQFFQQLAIEGVITEQEALNSNAAVIPAPLLTLIGMLPEDQQFNAKMLLSGATVFERNHPMTAFIGQAYGWTDEQINDFFRAASKI